MRLPLKYQRYCFLYKEFIFYHQLIWIMVQSVFWVSFHPKTLGDIFSRALCVCACSVAMWMSDSLRPRDRSPPGFSVHGISQSTILEWVAIFSYKGCFQPWDQTQVSRIAGVFFTTEPPGNPQTEHHPCLNNILRLFSAHLSVTYNHIP